jgi:tRNA A37 threonylcarbamoyladenosine dehydratase
MHVDGRNADMSLEQADKLIDMIARVNALDMEKSHKDELLKYLRWALRKAVKAYWYSTEINVD